uniref:SUEL-type lectin domain-containing protein n=1 Tax=Eutreptiella gymnastica TaxID=73025 RepID=A0A7S1NM33_9EUGL
MTLARVFAASGVLNGKLHMIAGDEGSGLPLASGEAWNPATNDWDSIYSLPTAKAVKHTTGIVHGGYFYVLGGVDKDGNSVTNVMRFDPNDNVSPWVSMNNMNSVRSHVVNAPSYDGKYYFVNGQNMAFPGIPLTNTAVWNPTADTWATISAAPTVPRYGHGSAMMGNKLYIVGGRSGAAVSTATNSLEVLDLTPAYTRYVGQCQTTAQCTGLIANVPSSSPSGSHRLTCQALCDADSNCAGYHLQDGTTTCTIYSVSTCDTTAALGAGDGSSGYECFSKGVAGWETLAPMTTARYYPQTVAYGGYLWVFGGVDGNGAEGDIQSSVEFYDPALNLWYTYSAMPRVRAGMGMGMIDDMIYMVSGKGNTGAFTHVVLPKFDFVALAKKPSCWEQNFTDYDFEMAGPYAFGYNLPYGTNGFQMTMTGVQLRHTTGLQNLLSKQSCTKEEGGFSIDVLDGTIRVAVYGTNYSFSEKIVANYTYEGLPTLMANTSYTIHITYQVSGLLSGLTNLMTIAVGGEAVSMKIDLPAEKLAHKAYIGGSCHPLRGTIAAVFVDCAHTTYPYYQDFNSLEECSTGCETDDCKVPLHWKNTPPTYDYHVPPILVGNGFRIGNTTATDNTGPSMGDHTYAETENPMRSWRLRGDRRECGGGTEITTSALPTVEACARACEGHGHWFKYGRQGTAECTGSVCSCTCEVPAATECNEVVANDWKLYELYRQPPGKFMYTETSSPCSDLTTYTLSTPYFSINDPTWRPIQGDITLSFWYHLWGRNVSVLFVDAEVNGKVHKGVGRVVANYNQWRKASIVLNEYITSNVTLLKFTFRYKAIGDQGDLAIDDVMLDVPAFKLESPDVWTIVNNSATVYLDGISNLGSNDLITVRDADCSTLCTCDLITTFYGQINGGTGLTRQVWFTAYNFYDTISICVNRNDEKGEIWLGNVDMKSHFTYLEEPTVGRQTTFTVAGGLSQFGFEIFEKITLRQGTDCNISNTVPDTINQINCQPGTYCTLTVNPSQAFTEAVLCLNRNGNSYPRWYLGPTFRVNNPFMYESTLLLNGTVRNIIRVHNLLDGLDGGKDAFELYEGECTTGSVLLPNAFFPLPALYFDPNVATYRDIYFSSLEAYYPTAEVSLCRTLKGVRARIGDKWALQDPNAAVEVGLSYRWDFKLLTHLPCRACDTDTSCLCTPCTHMPGGLSMGGETGFHPNSDATYTLNTGPGDNDMYMYVEGDCKTDAVLTTPLVHVTEDSDPNPVMYVDLKYHLHGTGQPIIRFDYRLSYADAWMPLTAPFVGHSLQWVRRVFRITSATNTLQVRARYQMGPTIESDFAIDNIEIGDFQYTTNRPISLGVPFKLRVPGVAAGRAFGLFVGNCSGIDAGATVAYEITSTHLLANISIYEKPANGEVLTACITNTATGTSTALKPPIDVQSPVELLNVPVWKKNLQVKIADLADYDPNYDIIKLAIGDCFGGCVSTPEFSTLYMGCPGGRVIADIMYASYGTGTTCGSPSSVCHHPNSLSIVRTRCLGYSNCSIAADNSIFSDPCVGIYKTLQVAYTCTDDADVSNLGEPLSYHAEGTTLMANFTPNASVTNAIMCLRRQHWDSFYPISPQFPIFWFDQDFTVAELGMPFNSSLVSINVYNKFGFDAGVWLELREGDSCQAEFPVVYPDQARLTVTDLAFDTKNLAFVPMATSEDIVVCQHSQGMTTMLATGQVVIDITQAYNVSSFVESFDQWPRMLDECNMGCSQGCKYFPNGFDFGVPAWTLYRPQDQVVGPTDDHSSSPEGCYVQTTLGCPNSPADLHSEWYLDNAVPAALTSEYTCLVTRKATWDALCGVSVQVKWVPRGSFLYWNSTDEWCGASSSVQMTSPYLSIGQSKIGAVPTLVFYYWIWGDGYGTLHIDGRADTQHGWTEDVYPVIMDDTGGWKLFSASLPSFMIPTHQLRFRFEPLGSSQSFAAIDDYQVVVPPYATEIPLMGVPTYVWTPLGSSDTLSFLVGTSCNGPPSYRRGTFIYQDYNYGTGIKAVNVVFLDMVDDLLVCTHNQWGQANTLSPNINVGNAISFDWEPVVGKSTLITFSGRNDWSTQDDLVVIRKDSCTGANLHNLTGESWASQDRKHLYFKFWPLEAYPTAVICLMRTEIRRDTSISAQYRAVTRPLPVHAASTGVVVEYSLPSQLFMVNTTMIINVNMTYFDFSNPGTIYFRDGSCAGPSSALALKLVSVNNATGFVLTVRFTKASSAVTICHIRNKVVGALAQFEVKDYSYSLTGVTVINGMFTLDVKSSGLFDTEEVVMLRKGDCSGYLLAYGSNAKANSNMVQLDHVVTNITWLGTVRVCLAHCTGGMCTMALPLHGQLHFSEYSFTYHVRPTWIQLVDEWDYNKIDNTASGSCIRYNQYLGDQTSCMMQLPKPFPFFEDQLWQVWMNSNGFLGNKSIPGESNVCPNTGPAGESKMMILQDDLITKGFYSRIYPWVCPHNYDMANPCTVFTWVNVTRRVDGLPAIGSTPYGQMQAILWPHNGHFVYQYSDYPFTESATIGLTNAAGTDGLAAVCKGSNRPVRRKEILFCRGPCDTNPMLYMGFWRPNGTAFNATFFKDVIARGAGVTADKVAVLSAGYPMIEFQLTGLHDLERSERLAVLNQNYNLGNLQLEYDAIDVHIASGHLLEVTKGSLQLQNVTITGSVQEGAMAVLDVHVTTDSNFYGLPTGGTITVGFPSARSLEITPLVQITMFGHTYSGDDVTIDGQQVTFRTSRLYMHNLEDGKSFKFTIQGVRPKSCKWVSDWVFYIKTSDAIDHSATAEWKVVETALPCFSECSACQYSHPLDDKVSDVYVCSKRNMNGDLLRWKRVSVRNPDGSTFCNTCGTSRCDSQNPLL